MFKINNKDTKMRSADNIYKHTIEQKASTFQKRKTDFALSFWKADVAIIILFIKEELIQ